MWIEPYSPTQFLAGDRRRHDLCEKHNIKVTCVTLHTKEGYQPVGKAKDINPIGHLYSHNDPDNVDTISWAYEGTCHLLPIWYAPRQYPRRSRGGRARQPVSTV